MDKNISSLPDFGALKKLSSVLWQQENSYHGAAIMIGAGFSRSAASTGDTTKKLPLWNDFAADLAVELSSKSADPLQLAEEYCAYFGMQALHDLIKNKVNDPAWAPGELHKSLLELPWTEVLTTNWDTLLERTAIEVHQPIYSVVTKQEDLASTKSPRIVKLHGTIDKTTELIFTQEDYRKYPRTNAAFVNFARQVFIENELCLLGFSGDDPNFLEWAGWVRDNLATHSRRIYLVGALQLNSAKRKYLESINVAPIDLECLVSEYDDQDTKHFEATRIFLQSLQELKPKPAWEWQPTQLHSSKTTTDDLNRRHSDADYAAKLLEEGLPLLETDRSSYPGWLVCPYKSRFQLQSQISSPWPNPKSLAAMTTNSRARLLYEIVWHYSVTYETPQPWLSSELMNFCDPMKPCGLTKKQQLEIAVFLLKSSRWMDSLEKEEIARATSDILEKGQKYLPNAHNELAYHRAIIARDIFDFTAVEENVEKIQCNNPIWKLRKAALLAELGEFDNGKVLVGDAYRELLVQHRNDQNSIHVFSRLAWAHWIMRGVDLSSLEKEFKAFPPVYREPKCDPWDHIEHIRDRISKELDKQQKRQGVEPLFAPGHYKDHSNTVTFSNELHPLLLLEGISNSVGMPLRWNGVSFLVEHASRLAELEQIDSIHCFALAIRAANDDKSDVINSVFSRVKVACLPDDDVDFLLRQCRFAIEYWLSKCSENPNDNMHYSIGRLRVFIEVLARVSIRATSEKAKELFHLSVYLGKKKELHNFWVFDALAHLAEFTLKSIPDPQKKDILLDALSFPLKKEININDHERWPNPIIEFPGERIKNAALDRRIDEIIDQIEPCSSQSAPALLRLLPLMDNNFLKQAELNKISDKLWGNNPDYKKIPDTGLLKYVLIGIPSPNPSSVRKLVRQHLFEDKGEGLFDSDILSDISNAATAEKTKELPSEEEALALFEKLVMWREKESDHIMLGYEKQEERRKCELIGKVLANSVVPVMPKDSLTEANFQKLYNFYRDTNEPLILISLSYFAANNDLFSESLQKIIIHEFQSDEGKGLSCASFSLLKWRDLVESKTIDKLVLRLIYLIGSNRIHGMSSVLWTVNEMFNKNYLSTENIDYLVDVIPLVFDNTSYGKSYFSSRDLVSISLVRAACVRLARDILKKIKNSNSELIRILTEAESDALPEVRYAKINQ